MKRPYCEKEAEIVAALRRGSLDSELENHASACAICSDVAAVSKFLQTQAAVAPPLPDSDFLWWKAQLAIKQSAVERATRSIVLVRRIAYCGISAAALWLVLAPGHLGSILGALSKREFWPEGVLSQSALFMVAGALVSTLLGSLYLARLEK
jgi:hypothetical protein